MTSLTFKIDGMHCDGCASRIQGLLEKEPGVRTAEVSFPDKEATVRFNRHAVSRDRLIDIVETAGFSVEKT